MLKLRVSGKAIAVCAVCLLPGAVLVAAERTSENDERLKQILIDRPQADRDRDGVLTITEVRAFQERLRNQRERADSATERFNKEHPRTATNVRYGPHERNALDFWAAKGDGPRPLAIYIHGGGWVTGDKDKARPHEVVRFLDAGISVAAISYRYSTIAPYPAPLRDGGLAVQFLRHHAKAYNIDPTRIACYGGSAGATTSLWLALHDDMADTDAADPVLRQSTRLTCAVGKAAPTSLDKATMDEWFGMKVVVHPAVYPLFGLEEGDESALYSQRIRKLAFDASPYNHLTPDDPPVYLAYEGRPLEPLPRDHSPGLMIHHPIFGQKLVEAAKKIGVEAHLQTRDIKSEKYEDSIDFVIDKLTR